MCSQPLTRAGRLCRDCERELAPPAREGDRAADALEGVVAEAGARMVASARHAPRWRVRNVLLLAFCVGALATLAAHLALDNRASPSSTRSVMLDRALRAEAAVAAPVQRNALTPR